MPLRTPIARPMLAALLLCGPISPAQAGPVLDHVRTSGTVRCGAAERPGLMDIGENGVPAGLLVELCRAVGTAVAGPSVRVVADVLDGPPAFEAVRAGRDDLVFLTGAEMVDHRLAGALLPGPAVYFAQVALMVPGPSNARRPEDLAGQPICFLQGEAAERQLEAWFAQRRLSFIRMGYQEPDEMDDAFDAGRCIAVAGEAASLAELRLEGGPGRRSGRILADPLATFPLVAATGTQDAAWAATVAWTLVTLEDADRPQTPGSASGAASLPVDAAALGLSAGWQAAVVAAGGSYAALFDRTLGPRSPLRLPPGPNALAGEGGWLAPPYAE